MHVHQNKNNKTVKHTHTSNNHLSVTQDLKQVPCVVKSQSSSHETVQRPSQGGCDSPVTMAMQYDVIPNAKGGTCMQCEYEYEYIQGFVTSQPRCT